MPHSPRDRLISSAIDLVRTYGVDATGVSELLEHSSTARRSIYQNFPDGKAELIAESTTAAGSWISSRLRHAADHTADPAALVRTVIDQVIRSVRADDYHKGCPIAAAATASPASAPVHEAAARVFETLTDELAAVLERDGRTAADARSLAGFILSTVEGALMRARCARSTEPLDQARAQLDTLIAATASPGATQ
ncbi:TetR/AcrR family transcriptional regulator [Aeromicrobium sp. CTD01-1L150]|uniref:TetR/AcrR family transcriptional regulator n=1 Tax=Aeromicrobium sp. CTD01-1L150 TaxID=3341830 RepID=UPI0035C23FF7